MNQPLVSIIMPAYNASSFILETINSVINQTYWHWELIIVDDGSTDHTLKILEPILKNNNQIKYVSQANSGQGKARNNGTKASSGDLIAFLDADDLWLNDKLQIQVDEFKNNPHIDLLFSGAVAFKDSTSNKIRNLNLNNDNIYQGIDSFKEFLKGNKVPILTVLVKKPALEAVGFFNESRKLQNVEDSHLWLKLLLANYQLKSSESVLAMYRLHDNQSTKNIFKNRLKEINLILDFFGKESSIDKYLLNEVSKKYQRLFINTRLKSEKSILFKHYTNNFKLPDKYFFRFMFYYFSLPIFSLYFRYFHSILPTFIKVNNLK